MKIIFWSEKKEIGTTFNMTAMACMASMKYSYKVAMCSGEYNNLDLELSFCGKQGLAVAESGNYAQEVDYGFDKLLKEKDGITAYVLKKNLIEIVKNSLYCLPAGKMKQAMHYPETLAPFMCHIVSVAEQCHDMVFIDCKTNTDLFTRKMLREADIVVVNMEQDSYSFSQFYRSHYDIKGRIFFLIGSYFNDDVYTKASLERIYRMGEENLGVVPYNIWMARSFLSGQIDRYFKRHLIGDLMDSQKEFFQELNETFYKLFHNNFRLNI